MVISSRIWPVTRSNRSSVARVVVGGPQGVGGELQVAHGSLRKFNRRVQSGSDRVQSLDHLAVGISDSQMVLVAGDDLDAE